MIRSSHIYRSERMANPKNHKTLFSFNKLSNRLFLQLATTTSIRQQLREFIGFASPNEFETKFSKLLENEKIRSSLTAFSRTIKGFSQDAFILQLPRPRLLALYKVVIRKSAPEINRFIRARDLIEEAILFGEYANARVLLEEMEACSGQSVWLIRCKMLVLSASDDTESFRQLCEECQEPANGLNAFIFKAAQLIADSGNATLQLAAVVDTQIAELREAKQETISSLLQVLFTPYALDDGVDHLSCLEYLQAYPVIDIYMCLLTILRIELTDYDEITDPGNELRDFAEEVRKYINDAVLSKLIDMPQLVSSGPATLPSDAATIFESYRSGNYFGAVAGFANRAMGLPSLALVNIAAKSLAYVNEETTGSNAEIINLARDLSVIYRLSPLWRQAEEQITSLCVKFNHLVISPCIQLSLLKALPFRYPARAQVVAARMSIASICISTPQTYFIANGNRCSWSFEDESHGVPLHRQLRESIAMQLSMPEVVQESVVPLLHKLRGSGALEKDVIECSVTYFLKTNNEKDLLRTAAEQLSFDGNRYICFPMEFLVEYIEENQLADLDAVIICYYYNKSVSDEQDNLLNELFEEYLLSTGALTPSQLLLKATALGTKEQLFFREICVPERMDYLGCFKTSNALRAERVLILDRLEELGAIGSEERMREVEEIVRQVIVDTGTSEFNSAKIYVEEAVLRKKHIQEIDSLIAVYKKLPDGPEERYTPVTQNSTSGVYLSGGKNSLVEKMYNLVGSSYLLDDKYGLDKNLSGEIRHGFFSNLMRARLEEHNLLTELDDQGAYLPNQHWRERNSLVRPEYWDEIDSILKGFSRDFDKIIAEAEEWMKICFQSPNSQRMFVFNLLIEELEQIKDVLSITSDADEIISYIMGLFSKRTEHALVAVRDRINGEFKTRIDDLFASTYEKIVLAKGELALVDLMSAFVRVRNEIQEDIHTASLWFYKNENPEISAGSLDRLVEIAVRSFEKVRGNAYRIHINIPSAYSSVPVHGRIGKPFILAIINLLDNCYKHSGFGQTTLVSIQGDLSKNTATLTIANNLTDDKRADLDEEAVDSIRKKLADSDISMHIRGEGGTGLIKASHEITYFGGSSSLTVTRENDDFVAKILYDFTGAFS
jgi:hypothetical protein